MAKPTLKVNTPVGDLNWVYILGEGKEDLNGNKRYSASVYFNSEAEAEPLKAALMDFWKDNKPKGATKPKSIGMYYEVESLVEPSKISQKSVTQPIDTEEFKATGRIIVNAWTGITLPDGKAKVVKTYNAKGAEVALGDKIIGPGSRGRLAIAGQVYESGANRGISLYLNGIQLTKFVELSGGSSFDAVDEEDGWTGDDLNDDGMGAVAPSAPSYDPNDEAPAKAKVKL
jgi:hypothetical protein